MKTYPSAPYSAANVARWFIARAEDEPGSPAITEPLLDQMLYYAQAYFLGTVGRPLFREAVQGSDAGQRVVGLDLSVLCAGGCQDIDGDFDLGDFTVSEIETLIKIWETFRSYHWAFAHSPRRKSRK